MAGMYSPAPARMSVCVADQVPQRLVEEKAELGSAEAFWAKWSDGSGQRKTCSDILKALKRGDKARYERDVASALQYFRGDLKNDPEGRFQYNHDTKKGIVYSAPFKVSQIWRDILETDIEVAQSWRRSQGDAPQSIGTTGEGC